MVIVWDQDNQPRLQLVRAAEYVRMSTEHQKYSTDNQSIAIRQYAEKRGYEIVKTYADEGKSGLNVDGRKALQQLIADIENGDADFEALIVYDVSRWGRFQDPDEAAAYELRCRNGGVAVHYCAEQFENDGSIGSSIIKTVKRAMAGEYSRELSEKVFAGQSHLIKLGYRQGGPAGFGLRRMLVDQNGNHKKILDRGEQKSIATDRIVLIPGPPHEIAVVREIFDLFANQGKTETQIAAILNSREILTDLGRVWTRGSVHQLLINEKYIGNNVWGKTSFKLKREHVSNDPDDWIRADNVFEAIVGKDIFQRTQVIIASRSSNISDDEMLKMLKSIFEARGHLSGLIIDETENCPSSSAFRSRFGSLLRAYSLVGYSPSRDYSYLEINRRLRQRFPEVVARIVEGITTAGGSIYRDEKTDLLTINEEFTASVTIARCKQTQAGSNRWQLRLDASLKPDVTIAVRMDETNENERDFYLLPRLDMREAVLRLCEFNGLSMDSYRYDNLNHFYQMARRVPFEIAA